MAQRVHVEIMDDLDGSAADETVGFSYEGTAYEIDLSGDNAAQMRMALAPYIEAGRTLSARSQRPAVRARRSRTHADREQTCAIRHWGELAA